VCVRLLHFHFSLTTRTEAPRLGRPLSQDSTSTSPRLRCYFWVSLSPFHYLNSPTVETFSILPVKKGSPCRVITMLPQPFPRTPFPQTPKWDHFVCPPLIEKSFHFRGRKVFACHLPFFPPHAVLLARSSRFHCLYGFWLSGKTLRGDTPDVIKACCTVRHSPVFFFPRSRVSQPVLPPPPSVPILEGLLGVVTAILNRPRPTYTTFA